MMRRLMEWVLENASSLVDDTVPQADLYRFLEEQLELLVATHPDSQLESPPIIKEIRQACERLRRFSPFTIPDLPQAQVSGDPGEGVRYTGELVLGGRISLQALRALRDGAWSHDARNQNLDKLLRRIEVKRRAALKFDTPVSERERWQWAAELSLVFSRHALTSQDVRYLNTAMKLNDWAFAYCSKRSTNQACQSFLLAALEAEATMLEMTA